jgi:HK97 gp10 family phage protein
MSKAFPVTGGKEIAATLTALGKRIETQAVRSGLTAGAAVIRDEAKLRAPKKAGAMSKSIKTGSPRKNEDGSYSVSVRLVGPHAFLGFFHEYGVRPHLIASTGKGQGRVAVRKAAEGSGTVDNGTMKIGDEFVSGIISHPGHAAQPFMRPALDAKAQEAIAAFRSKIVAVVEGKTGFNLDAQDEAA